VLEQALVTQNVLKKQYAVAIAMIQNAEEEFRGLDKSLKEIAESLDKSSAEKLLRFAEEDLDTWLFLTNLSKFRVYEEQGNYDLAGKHLKKMFEHNLYLNRITAGAFLTSFEEHFFQVTKQIVSEIESGVKEGAVGRLFTPEDYNAMGLASLVRYAAGNRRFNVDEFFQWLERRYPREPVVYMYWGAVHAYRDNYAMASEKLKESVELFPASPVLNLLYHKYVLHRRLQNAAGSPEKQEAAVKEFVNAVEKYVKSPEVIRGLLGSGFKDVKS